MFNHVKNDNKTLEELYSMFANAGWDKLSKQQRVLLMKNVLDKEQEKVQDGGYQKADMQLISLDRNVFSDDIAVEFGILGEGYAGMYDPDRKCITLKEGKSGICTYYNLMHEFQTAIQDYLIGHMGGYNEKPEEYEYIERLRIVRDECDKKISFCNISGEADFHLNIISSETCPQWAPAHDLSEMFYTLNITERDAFYYAREKGDNAFHCLKQQNINLDIDCDYKFLVNELSEFRKTYHCPNISDTEIFEVIDKCIDNLYMGILPEDDLCATVMYDIACIMLILRKESSGEDICEEDLELLSPENKRRNMAKENFAVYGEGTRYGKYIIVQDLKNHENEYSMDIDKFLVLTPEQKKNNPKIILLAASRIGDEIKEHIANLDALKAFCMADKELLKPANNLREGMAVIFGDEFVGSLYGEDE